MGRQPEPLCGARAAGRAVAGVGTGQTDSLPPVRAQTPSRCYGVDCNGRGGEAHIIRAAFRHDQAEVDELRLVCVGLWQMASRN